MCANILARAQFLGNRQYLGNNFRKLFFQYVTLSAMLKVLIFLLLDSNDQTSLFYGKSETKPYPRNVRGFKNLSELAQLCTVEETLMLRACGLH